MSRNILIVSAHPDDMEIGMGGTVAKLVAEQAEITSLVVTDGGRASNPFGWTEQRMAEVRRAEALRAAEVLGVKDVIFCDQPDAADEVDVKAVGRKLVELMTRLKPTEVYTLHEELDRHPGHRQAGRLVRESVSESGLHADAEGSGPMKSGARSRDGIAWSTLMPTWRKRDWPSRSIAVRWRRFLMVKECSD